jgi:zinc protease
LREHHARLYCPANGFMIVSGQFDDTIFEQLNEHFGQQPAGIAAQPTRDSREQPTEPKREHLKMSGAQQTSLWMGRPLFSRDHADYAGLFTLNTVLGGFFGSRMMSNIREKRGLTYHISSSLDMMWRTGMWSISAEIKLGKQKQVLSEVMKEMEKLCQAAPESEEWEMVHNYILGGFLSMVDGPLAMADTGRTMLVDDVGFGHFDDLVAKVRQQTGAELPALATKYFAENDWWVVTAG